MISKRHWKGCVNAKLQFLVHFQCCQTVPFLGHGFGQHFLNTSHRDSWSWPIRVDCGLECLTNKWSIMVNWRGWWSTITGYLHSWFLNTERISKCCDQKWLFEQIQCPRSAICSWSAVKAKGDNVPRAWGKTVLCGSVIVLYVCKLQGY